MRLMSAVEVQLWHDLKCPGSEDAKTEIAFGRQRSDGRLSRNLRPIEELPLLHKGEADGGKIGRQESWQAPRQGA